MLRISFQYSHVEKLMLLTLIPTSEKRYQIVWYPFFCGPYTHYTENLNLHTNTGGQLYTQENSTLYLLKLYNIRLLYSLCVSTLHYMAIMARGRGTPIYRFSRVLRCCHMATSTLSLTKYVTLIFLILI